MLQLRFNRPLNIEHHMSHLAQKERLDGRWTADQKTGTK